MCQPRRGFIQGTEVSPFSKLVLAAVAALSGVAASAHVDAPRFQAREVIASHEATPALSAVVERVKHRHHRHKHRAHPVRSAR